VGVKVTEWPRSTDRDCPYMCVCVCIFIVGIECLEVSVRVASVGVRVQRGLYDSPDEYHR